MKRNIFLVAIVACMVLSACDSLDMKGMFLSSGPKPDERVKDWLEYNKEHGTTVISDVPDTYKFYVCSDIHVTDSAPRFRAFLRAELNDPEAYFSILNGDLANEGGEDPFRAVASAIEDLCPAGHDTCFCLIGNHDIYFDCADWFKKYFHTSTNCVIVKTQSGAQDLYVFTDSGNATFGADQMRWLSEVLGKREEYRHVVVATHTRLFRNIYNYSTTPAANLPQEEYYQLLDMMSKNKVDLFLMGHFHHKEQHKIGGVQYVMTDNLNETQDVPSYLVVTCGEKVRYEYVDLNI